jgi:hypothetical protein
MEKKSAYAKARKIFLALFLLSTSAALVMASIGASKFNTLAGPSIDITPEALTIGGFVAIVSSCITSLVTLVGFLSTTILAWRKEAREKEDRELERKRKELELEKARLELEKIKGEEDGHEPK